ncbi:MAG: glucose-6-phosphate isomerase, partial [Gammaproteobacteria bacterium]|nr:glucose-6-phosphate isomerase [Gammaproteobacteria bacterium]
HPRPEHHLMLYANALAQMQAFMQGKSSDAARQELIDQGFSEAEIEKLLPHKIIPGNKPSIALVFEKLTPYTLGMLLALYEHKVFVQSVVWNINAFDQWGVELGKQLSDPILNALQNQKTTAPIDSSTAKLIELFKA